MPRSKQPRFSEGHKALNEFIEAEFGGNKAAASRAAVAGGFPVGGTGEGQAHNAVIAIGNLSNGFTHQPSLERILWLQENWKIPMRAWATDCADV